MSDERIKADIANHYLVMTPAGFDDWLADKEREEETRGMYGIIRGAMLARVRPNGHTWEEWARDNADPGVLSG